MNEENQARAQQAPVGLRAQIDLPAPVATWVLAAHAVAVLTPLVLLWAVHANWDYVAGQANAPGFFYVAVAFMMASGAFEFARIRPTAGTCCQAWAAPRARRLRISSSTCATRSA